MDTTTMDQITRMIAAGDQQRYDRAVKFLATLTRTEFDLVRDAAALGYAIGWEHGATYAYRSRIDDSHIPPDREILAQVADRFREPLNVGQLPPRDRWLFHDAGVHAFVIAERGGRIDSHAGREYPNPSADSILVWVVQRCQAMSDLYPVIADSPSDLVWMLVRRHSGPVSRVGLVDAVQVLLACAADRVEEVIEGYLGDGRLVERSGGLLTVGPDD